MDYNHKGNGILIDEILRGGPLDKAAYKLSAGMIIERIDGETIVPTRDISQYLNRKAGKFTLLEIRNPKTAR